MIIKENIFYVGVNDRDIDLFEGQYFVPNGMAYNSYVLMDEKIAVMDSVDGRFGEQWIKNIKEVVGDKVPDYLVVQHMEPDHSSSLMLFAETFKNATIVASSKAFTMMKNFYGNEFYERRIVVKEGDTLNLGRLNLNFVTAPMVHWPEVIMTYESTTKTLFSADGFGKFGSLDTKEDWACEARRYYFGIVGKYGMQVQTLLKKVANTKIETICPLHGPILSENLGYYLNLYDIWSSYGVESEGIVIAYTSVYGNTKKAVELLAQELKNSGYEKVVVNDLARCDMAEAVEDAFRYGKIVFATTTYNNDIFPFMKEFINNLTERNFQNKKVGIIENGSWAPNASKGIKDMLKNCKNITFCENEVKVLSSVNDENLEQIKALAKEL